MLIWICIYIYVAKYNLLGPLLKYVQLRILGIRWAVVAHTFNPSTLEAVAGESLLVQGQPSLQELVPG